jgi:spore germination cell wall hydrolase CwlJ-like protein
MSGAEPDPAGATYYYATTMPKASAWTPGAKQTLELDHHVFFKNMP